MIETPSSELAEASRLRRRAVPQRIVAVVLTAAVLQAAFGWPLIWLWAAGYALVTFAESEIGRRYADAIQRGGRARAWPYVAAVTAVSLAYGFLAIPLVLFEHLRDGEVYAVLLLAGGLVNLLIVSRGSWAAFAATAGPYGAYLLLLPLLAAVAGVDSFSWVGQFAALLLLAHTYAAWRRQRQSLTAEAAARAEVEARSAQAEAATAAKSAFVAMVSHELRTPLSGVLAAGSQLKAAGLSERARREATDVVVDGGRFMHALLDDLLDLAKLDAGKMTTETVEFDLGHLVWSLQRHWTAAAEPMGKPVQLVSASGLPILVRGDPTRIRQILNNLLSNAVKFTGPEGVTWTVDVCAGPSCAELGSLGMTVSVTDTGPGMSSEQLGRLFTAFDQTSETVARTHGGTGLGLALSRELARSMGGELSVESRSGEGSTFTLHLPMAPAEMKPVAAPEPAEAGPELGSALRVLVVDDHPLNRRTLSLLLEPAGVEVTAVESSTEALERLAAETFDAVLTDLNMPGMNGLALARAVRAMPGPNAHVPLVAVTGADSAEERAACLAAGMTGYVTKPIDVAALYAALEAALTPAEAVTGAPKAA